MHCSYISASPITGVIRACSLPDSRRRVALRTALRHAIVLIQAPHRSLQVDAPPVRMTVLHEPAEAGEDLLRELPDDCAVAAVRIVREQQGLHGNGPYGARLPWVRAGGDLRGGVRVQDGRRGDRHER